MMIAWNNMKVHQCLNLKLLKEQARHISGSCGIQWTVLVFMTQAARSSLVKQEMIEQEEHFHPLLSSQLRQEGTWLFQ